MRGSCCLSRIVARSTCLHTPPLLLQVALSTLDTLLLTWPWEAIMKLNVMQDENLQVTSQPIIRSTQSFKKYIYIYLNAFNFVCYATFLVYPRCSNHHLTYSWEVLLLLLLLLWRHCRNCIYLTITLTCTRPTRGMAWAARHLFQIEEGSGGAFRNTCDPSQTIIKTPQLNYNMSF